MLRCSYKCAVKHASKSHLFVRCCQPCWRRNTSSPDLSSNSTGSPCLNFSRFHLSINHTTMIRAAALGRLQSSSSGAAEGASRLQGPDQVCGQGGGQWMCKMYNCCRSCSLSQWSYQVSRGYFTDESTSEMLAKWTHMLCPADRSSNTTTKFVTFTVTITIFMSQSVRQGLIFIMIWVKKFLLKTDFF